MFISWERQCGYCGTLCGSFRESGKSFWSALTDSYCTKHVFGKLTEGKMAPVRGQCCLGAQQGVCCTPQHQEWSAPALWRQCCPMGPPWVLRKGRGPGQVSRWGITEVCGAAGPCTVCVVHSRSGSRALGSSTAQPAVCCLKCRNQNWASCSERLQEQCVCIDQPKT